MYKSPDPEPLLPGIPAAPTGKRFITAAEIDYQKRKRVLATRLPVLKPEDLIGSFEQPFYQILLRDLMASGHSLVADEINNLLRKEERDRKTSKHKHRGPPETRLIDQPEVLQRISDSLKLCQTLLSEGKKESAMLICKTLADSFLLQDTNTWLARHFYLSTLSKCRKICPKTTDRLQAEIHCLLAYIARENNESLESALAIAIDHLAVCRTLSRDQNWQFKPNTILIRLKRPLAFYGINTEDVYEVVDACTMSLYMIASLLEHELLISLANQIMHSPHHKAPTDEDLKNAHEFADLALKLALEVRQPVALSSALTRFGIVLRHVGAYDDAMKYFHQLQQHAMLNGDAATESIAYHNMGLCFIGMLNSVEALECFAKQKELASSIVTKELEGNAMHEIGHLLLQEGHLWEAEECYAISFEDFWQAHHAAHHKNEEGHRKSHDSRRSSSGGKGAHHHDAVSRMEVAWGMFGVAAGQKLWSRLAGLCRSGKPKDIRSVLQFKCGRKPLAPVGRPDYSVEDVADIKKPWELSSVDQTDPTIQESETSWEEHFMFSKHKKHKKHHHHKNKHVGFGTMDIEAHNLEDEHYFGGGSARASERRSKAEEAFMELKRAEQEIEDEENSRKSLNQLRIEAQLAKDKQRSHSVLSRPSTKSIVAIQDGDAPPGEAEEEA